MMHYPNKEIFAVTALVTNGNGEVLAVSRRNEPDNLGLPGGKIDPGETPEEALVRELREETGLTAEKFYSIFEREDEESSNKVSRTFFVSQFEGTPKTVEEGLYVSWVKPERLFENNCTFRNYNKKLFETVSLSNLSMKENNMSIGKPIYDRVWVNAEARRRSPIQQIDDETLDKWALKKEIELVHDVITHPSGMHIELFGMIYIRPCNSNGQILYEVGLEIDDNRFDHKTFTDPMKAAEEFVKLRFAHELGVDIEFKLFLKDFMKE